MDVFHITANFDDITCRGVVCRSDISFLVGILTGAIAAYHFSRVAPHPADRVLPINFHTLNNDSGAG